MKTIQLVQITAIALAALSVSSCNSQDYLYYSDHKATTQDRSYNIKTLVGSSQVNILWIIDNSGSMDSHQQDVILNTDIFMNAFLKSSIFQWRMGLISTDQKDSPYVGFNNPPDLDDKTRDPVPVFQNAVSNLGTSGDGFEKMFSPVMNALNHHPKFLYSSGTLALIIVTDAPEQTSWFSSKEFLDYLKSVRGDLHDVIIYGVLGPQDFGCPQTDDFWNYAGSKYEAVINGTHGKVYKLCEPFGTSLASLGKDLASRITSSRIFLNSRPKMSTLKVLYHDKEVKQGTKETGGFWIYDFSLNAVVFSDLSFAPGDNEDVRVVYEEDDGVEVPKS